MPKPFMKDPSTDEGNWLCSKCGNMNYSFRQFCNMRKCGAPKPENPILPLSPTNRSDHDLLSSQVISPKSESSENSSYKLFESVAFNGLDSIITKSPKSGSVTPKSQSGKVPPQATQEDWVCVQCGNLNYGFRVQCNMRKCRAWRCATPYFTNVSQTMVPVIYDSFSGQPIQSPPMQNQMVYENVQTINQDSDAFNYQQMRQMYNQTQNVSQTMNPYSAMPGYVIAKPITPTHVNQINTSASLYQESENLLNVNNSQNLLQQSQDIYANKPQNVLYHTNIMQIPMESNNIHNSFQQKNNVYGQSNPMQPPFYNNNFAFFNKQNVNNNNMYKVVSPINNNHLFSSDMIEDNTFANLMYRSNNAQIDPIFTANYVQNVNRIDDRPNY